MFGKDQLKLYEELQQEIKVVAKFDHTAKSFRILYRDPTLRSGFQKMSVSARAQK
jgi:hypothetical protein